MKRPRAVRATSAAATAGDPTAATAAAEVGG